MRTEPNADPNQQPSTESHARARLRETLRLRSPEPSAASADRNTRRSTEPAIDLAADINIAHWPGLLEHELIPYQAMSASEIRPMLVLAPHPDDEVFACGGLLALAARHGVPAHVAGVADGGQGGEAAAREAESLAAARVLGGDATAVTIEFWRLPDRGLRPDATLRQRIDASIQSSRAEWVVAPSPFEVHPDHRAVCLAAIAAVQQRLGAGQPAQLLLCEIGQPLLPNCLVDITAVADLKAQAMRCFASQMAQQAYAEQMAGLNRYRSYTLGPAVTHAEAFWLVPAAAVADGIEGVLAAVGELLRQRL